MLIFQSYNYHVRQIEDLERKLNNSKLFFPKTFLASHSDSQVETNVNKNSPPNLVKAEKDATKTTIEVVHGLISQTMKVMLFNRIMDKSKDD